MADTAEAVKKTVEQTASTAKAQAEKVQAATLKAIAKRPAVLLCDEPTGALDSETGIVVLEAIDRVNRELGAATALITHNADIQHMADRVVHLANGLVTAVDVNEKRVRPSELHW